MSLSGNSIIPSKIETLPQSSIRETTTASLEMSVPMVELEPESDPALEHVLRMTGIDVMEGKSLAEGVILGDTIITKPDETELAAKPAQPEPHPPAAVADQDSSLDEFVVVDPEDRGRPELEDTFHKIQSSGEIGLSFMYMHNVPTNSGKSSANTRSPVLITSLSGAERRGRGGRY